MIDDYDLEACLAYNEQDFLFEDILKILAVYEEEYDCEGWHWILKLTDNRYAYLTGWCDYTGWDCQSDATSIIDETSLEALKEALKKDPNINENHSTVKSLINQLSEGKIETWREKTDRKFDLDGD